MYLPMTMGQRNTKKSKHRVCVYSQHMTLISNKKESSWAFSELFTRRFLWDLTNNILYSHCEYRILFSISLPSLWIYRSECVLGGEYVIFNVCQLCQTKSLLKLLSLLNTNTILISIYNAPEYKTNKRYFKSFYTGIQKLWHITIVDLKHKFRKISFFFSTTCMTNLVHISFKLLHW